MDETAPIDVDPIPDEFGDPARDGDGRLRHDANGELVPAAADFILRRAGYASADAFREAVRAESAPEARATHVDDHRVRGRKVAIDPDWPGGRPEGWPPAPEPKPIFMPPYRQVGVVRNGILAGVPIMEREQLDLATITEWHTGKPLADVLDAPRRNGKKGAAVRQVPDPPLWHEEARKLADGMRDIKLYSKAQRIADFFKERDWPGQPPKKDTIYKVIKKSCQKMSIFRKPSD